uniref:Uncharacterized protein n=1 Tax=Aegilops tauschii TaxID=37682 RepID=M8C9R2_AEGTA
MPAAMRLCARALRRTQQPAVASTQQRWVSTRWFGKTRATTAEELKDLARAAEMKEELYNTISDITAKYKAALAQVKSDAHQ